MKKRKKIRKAKSNGKLYMFWFRFSKNRLAVIGLFILIAMTTIAVTAPLFIDPELTEKQVHTDRLQGPSREHLLGTDCYGRDILARIVYGSRISLSVGFAVVGISLLFGGIIGSIAGFFGGRVDNTLMRLMDVFMAIPGTILALAVVAALGTTMVNLLIALAISRVPHVSRIVRAAVLSQSSQEYVEAARSYGCSVPRIIMRQVLPNALGPILVQITLSLGTTILAISGLSYIGLGIQPPTPEWGNMLSEAKEYLRLYPWQAFPAGIAIMLSVFSFNQIGDGLRDAFDPKLRN